MGGINALRFLCQAHRQHGVSLAGVTTQLLRIEAESGAGRFCRGTVHRAFQNLASSRSIGSGVSSCVLNILMESRLCDGGGGGDADAWRQDSAARVLRALLETPKGTSATGAGLPLSPCGRRDASRPPRASPVRDRAPPLTRSTVAASPASRRQARRRCC